MTMADGSDTQNNNYKHDPEKEQNNRLRDKETKNVPF